MLKMGLLSRAYQSTDKADAVLFVRHVWDKEPLSTVCRLMETATIQSVTRKIQILSIIIYPRSRISVEMDF